MERRGGGGELLESQLHTRTGVGESAVCVLENGEELVLPSLGKPHKRTKAQTHSFHRAVDNSRTLPRRHNKQRGEFNNLKKNINKVVCCPLIFAVPILGTAYIVTSISLYPSANNV